LVLSVVGQASAWQFRRAKARPAAAIAAALFATTVAADPFPSRDLNPLLAGFGIPGAMPARLTRDSWSVSADLNWASTALMQRVGSEQLIVDAEVREARVVIGHVWSERFATQLQLPYRYTGGGVLDGVINGWHDFFDLPEGARTQQPQDAFRIAYARDGSVLLNTDTPASGLGDASLDFGYQLTSSPATAVTAWLSLKLPTGDAGDFTGSQSTDVSVMLAAEQRLSDRWSLFAQAGATWLGDGERLVRWQRDVVWSGLAGASFRASRGLDLKVQLDAHSAIFDDSELDFLGGATVLTLGGDYRFASGWTLDLAVSEDIAVESASDVVFVVGLRREWK
jgi:hypothetical protein